MMKTYRVLWFDDEHETLEIIKESAIINGVTLVPFDNEEEGIRELDRGLHLYDAVVVDGRFYRKAGQSGDALNDNAWVSVARYFDKWSDRKVMPWFILSGQISITKSKNTFVEIYKNNRVYDKLVEDDIQLLWEDIKLEADKQIDTQLRHKYNQVFDVCTEKYIGAETAKSLLYLLRIIESENVDFETEEKINTIRKVIERVLTAFNRIGVLPSDVLTGKGGINNSSKFLCNDLPSFTHQVEILPRAIAFLLKNLTQVTQDASHSEGDLSLKTDQFIKSQPTGYFFKSVVFQLFELLVWLKTYFDNNQDLEENKLIALRHEINSSTQYEGIIEQDDLKNYFCGEYLLGYNAVYGKYNLGDTIKIIESTANTQSRTRHLYTKFGSKFIRSI